MSEVWASMATLRERAGARAMAVESLLPQVDRLVIALGDVTGDQIKFAACEQAPGYFFCVDDDLVYPDDYVERTIEGLQEHPGCIVGYHGWTIDDEGDYIDLYRCLDQVDEAAEVDLLGTGVCAFHVDTIRPLLSDFPEPNVAQFWFAVLAARAGVPRVVLPHPDRWFGYVEHRRTMWTETARETGSFLDYSVSKRAALTELIRLRTEPACL